MTSLCQTYANDLANEQEKELLQREQRLQKQDEYVTELRGRIAKLTNHENAYEVSCAASPEAVHCG